MAWLTTGTIFLEDTVNTGHYQSPRALKIVCTVPIMLVHKIQEKIFQQERAQLHTKITVLDVHEKIIIFYWHIMELAGPNQQSLQVSIHVISDEGFLKILFKKQYINNSRAEARHFS